MARKKKPENETMEQKDRRVLFEKIANTANRSEKTSWNRKMDNMVKLMARLSPVEEKILDIIKEEKNPILDDIAEVRKTMIVECVHPIEYLVEDGDIVRCRFCEKKIVSTNAS